MKRKTRRLVTVVALTTGVAGAVLVPTLAAVAASSPGAHLKVTVTKTVLEAHGAAVKETISYTCPTGTRGTSMQVSLTERVGKIISDGNSYVQNLGCTGKTRTVAVYLQAQDKDKAFKKGKAFTQAQFFVNYGQDSLTDSRTVTLS